MRALVTGTQGQVALSMAERQANWPGIELSFLGRPNFDLRSPEALVEEILRQKPDAVLSVAAYTAVDQAEDEPELAREINAIAPGVLAAAAAEISVPIVHLSTDYVFPGGGDQPLTEEDEISPMTSYGRSKLEGEQLVADANEKHVVLRTAWVYSPFGKNFVKTMLHLAKDRDELIVVDDQHGAPTCALDIADGLFAVLEKLSKQDGNTASYYGTYHMVGAQEGSWCEFAREIFHQSRALNGPYANVTAVDSSAYPAKAKRPINSRLNMDKFKRKFGCSLPGYPEALGAVIPRLLAEA